MSDFTVLLRRFQHGDAKAAEELLPLIYQELHGLAAWKMAGEISSQLRAWPAANAEDGLWLNEKTEEK